MQRKTVLILLAVLLLVVVMTAGCGPAREDDQASPGDPMETKNIKVFRVNLLSTPLTIDPVQAQTESELILVRALYSTLVQYKEGEITPALAKNWYYSADGKALYIQLKEDLKFSNGRPLTAMDVEFSLERVINPDLASPYAHLLTAEIGGRDAVPGAIELTGTHSLVIRFSVPRRDFVELLAHPCFSIVSKDSFEKRNYGIGADLSSVTNVAASGPLNLVEWVDNQNIALEPNKHYFSTPPALDRVEMVVDRDMSTTMYDFGTEYLDLVVLRESDIHRIVTEYPDMEHKLVAGPVDSVYFLSVNPNVLFFKDIRTRQAVLGAVDVSEILESSKIFTPAENFLRRPPRGGLSNDDPKSLLWAAGYVGEKKPPGLVLSYPPDNISRSIAGQIKDQLGDTLGIEVTLKETVPQRQLLYDNGAHLSLIRWTIPYPGKSAFFPYLFANGGNPFTVGQPGGETARLYFDQAGMMKNASQRENYYELISNAVSSEMVLNSLVEVKNLYAVQRNLKLDIKILEVLGLSEEGNKLGK